MGTIGYRPSGGTPDYLRLKVGNPYNYRAYKPDGAAKHGWAVSMTARIGKLTATAPECRLIVFAPHLDPREIQMQTDSFYPNVTMLDGSGGSLWTVNLPGTFKIFPGDSFELGAIAMDPGAGLGMIQAATAQGHDYYTFWSRDDGAMPPADPMGWSYSSYEGWMAISLNYDDNVKPNVPSGRKLNGIAGDNLVSPTFTPTFEWDFSDPNEVLSNGVSADYLNGVEIKVTRVSDGATVWSLSQTGTDAERSAKHITRVYAGSALASGVPYQWQGRHSDRMNFWSDWSAPLTFTVGAGQVIVSGTGLGTPSGKQETNQPGPFVAKWQHSGGLATTAVQARLLDDAGNLLSAFASGDIAKAVANNGTISTTFAETGFAALNWGSPYQWQMRGKASDGNWSGWSAPIAFSTNEAPSVPTGLSPDGSAWSAYPLLSCKVTDPDDTVATGLVVKAEIFNAANTLLGTYAMALRSGTTDTWDLQTSATHLPSYQAYSWRAYAGDGTLWSGRQTLEASAIRSATAQFTYAAGPSITITSPANGSTIGTATPTLAWTAPAQTARRVELFDLTAGGGALLDTGSVVTALTTYAIPDGKITQVGHVYKARVTITDASSLTGTAETSFTFTIAQPAAPTGWLVAPMTLLGDDPALGEASAVKLSWNQSDDPAFAWYLIERQPSSGQAIDPDDAGGWTRLRKETSRTTTQFIDYSPASGVAYQYRVSVYTQTAGQTLNSAWATGEIMVSFAATILYDVADPEGTRVVLPYRGPRRTPRNGDKTALAPWGRKRPTILRSEAWHRTPSASYQLLGSPEEVAAAIRKLDYMDALGADVCYRDGEGLRGFGTLMNYEIISPGGGALREASFAFQPTDYEENAA